MSTEESQSCGEDSREIAELIVAADAAFYAMRRGRAAIVGGVTLSQLALLEALLDEPALPVSKLASLAVVATPTATRMLNQLETRDLVRRERSPQDDRVVLVSLTEQGRQSVSTTKQRLREHQTAGFSTWTSAERRAATKSLNRLAAFINEWYSERFSG